MVNKKTIIYIAIVITTSLIALLFINLKSDQPTPVTPSIQSKPEVMISIDKDNYSEGDEIKIEVKNSLDQDIFYYPGGDRFWGIEYYGNDKWNRFGYGGRKGFQLIEEKVGNECYTVEYEQVLPESLKPSASLVTKWNQIICPFIEEYNKPSIVQYIRSGKYRLSFRYGFELSKHKDSIIEPKTVYSNIFLIK